MTEWNKLLQAPYGTKICQTRKSLRWLAMAFPLRVFSCRQLATALLHGVERDAPGDDKIFHGVERCATADDSFSTASFLPSPTAERFS